MYELGDRLAEKLMMKKEKMEAKLGNMTCVLQEMNMLDDDLQLDLQVGMAIFLVGIFLFFCHRECLMRLTRLTSAMTGCTRRPRRTAACAML